MTTKLAKAIGYAGHGGYENATETVNVPRKREDQNIKHLMVKMSCDHCPPIAYQYFEVISLNPLKIKHYDDNDVEEYEDIADLKETLEYRMGDCF